MKRPPPVCGGGDVKKRVGCCGVGWEARTLPLTASVLPPRGQEEILDLVDLLRLHGGGGGRKTSALRSVISASTGRNSSHGAVPQQLCQCLLGFKRQRATRRSDATRQTSDAAATPTRVEAVTTSSQPVGKPSRSVWRTRIGRLGRIIPAKRKNLSSRTLKTHRK